MAEDKQTHTKAFIQLPAGPFYTVATIWLSASLIFWKDQSSDMKVVKDRIETIREDKSKVENKVDKMALNYFELNDKIVQVKDAVDELRDSRR